jgi:hypothetical protein
MLVLLTPKSATTARPKLIVNEITYKIWMAIKNLDP